MPPLKKMKSNSGWADIMSDFSRKESKTVKKNVPTIKKKLDVPGIINYSSIIKKSDKMSSLTTIIEACNPKESSELTLSRQKQNELDDWLYSKTLLGRPRILVLSGPSGCGKTIALKILAKESGFDVIEWITPTDSGIVEKFATRQSDKFLDFLIRATRYNSIFDCNKRRLLLVKDIPNIYFIDKESFHNLLENYMKMGREPLVFVIADAESSRASNILFPATIIEQFEIDTINIPAATPTAMKNMVKRVSSILNLKAGHMLNVTQSHIDEILSNSVGDVRSTIFNIIFASLKVPDEHLKSDCGTREQSLGLLHGIGRVINPKRIPDGNSWKFVHDPDEIASYFQSQASIFLQFLQENYLNTMSTIDEVDRCSEIMSLSDTLTIEWRDINLSKANLSLCVRGVMVNNENPATKWNPVRKPKSEDTKIQRDLNVAEEIYYKTIIKPTPLKDPPDIENTIDEA